MLCCRRRNTALVAELPRLRRWVLGKHTLLTTIPTHNTCATKWYNAHTTAHTTTGGCGGVLLIYRNSRFNHTLFDRNRCHASLAPPRAELGVAARRAKWEHKHGTGRKAMYYRCSTATF